MRPRRSEHEDPFDTEHLVRSLGRRGPVALLHGHLDEERRRPEVAKSSWYMIAPLEPERAPQPLPDHRLAQVRPPLEWRQRFQLNRLGATPGVGILHRLE